MQRETMNSCHKVFFLASAGILLSLSLSMSAVAQGPADLTVQDQTTTAPAQQKAATADPADDDRWHFVIAPYLWFPGISGTAGARGHNASVHTSATNLLGYFNFGIMGTVEARKNRWVFPLDFMWMRLGDNKSLPETDLGATSINVKVTESIFTPKFGYRMADTERWKFDVLAGIRYWYLGESLSFQPVGFLGGISRSQGWVDGLFGMRTQLVLSPKAAITAFGDVGAGGANLDYQAGGLFGYNFSPLVGLQLGWRYLYVNYQGNNQFLFNAHMSGPMVGVTFSFPNAPPVPPSASCSAQPTEVWSGDPVKVTATGANFNLKHTVTYGWTGNGGKLSGANAETATVDTTEMVPGSYSATATITDPKEKKNNSATCTANFSIKQPQPPVVSCSANPTTIAIGESSTITMSASDPQGWPLTYSWSTAGGQLSGSGTTATVTATNADAGNTITVTGTATDARANLSASCTASVTVPAVQKCTVIEDWGECTFEKNPKKPWRVDNDCKDTLDKLSLRLQQMPNGKLNVVGYTNEEESVKVQQLGSQRSVNVKYYLTTDGPNKADASRIQPRQGGTKGQATHFYFVPEGNMCGGQLEEGTVVDETQVQGQSRTAAPAPKKKAKKAAVAPPGN
jgi:hypothetical protein